MVISVQQSDLEGLTGSLRFGEDGRRENFTLSVVEMTVNSDIVKVKLDRLAINLVVDNATAILI